jgi:hypothetical protein
MAPHHKYTATQLAEMNTLLTKRMRPEQAWALAKEKSDCPQGGWTAKYRRLAQEQGVVWIKKRKRKDSSDNDLSDSKTDSEEETELDHKIRQTCINFASEIGDTCRKMILDSKTAFKEVAGSVVTFDYKCLSCNNYFSINIAHYDNSDQHFQCLYCAKTYRVELFAVIN